MGELVRLLLAWRRAVVPAARRTRQTSMTPRSVEGRNSTQRRSAASTTNDVLTPPRVVRQRDIAPVLPTPWRCVSPAKIVARGLIGLRVGTVRVGLLIR